MTKNINPKIKESPKEISEKDVNLMLKRVRDFQEQNQKYLINKISNTPNAIPSIINMTNTSF